MFIRDILAISALAGLGLALLPATSFADEKTDMATSVASAQGSAEEEACILSAINKMPQRGGPITASRVMPYRDTRPRDAEMLPGDAEMLIVELDFSTAGINGTSVF